jgi:hypothetical protein
MASGAMFAAPQPQPLVLEAKIALGNVQGRIDHLTFDAGRQRLYVAELGNDSVGVVDLKNHAVLRTLAGFHEPQGIAYDAATDTLYVANAGDGTVRLLHGSDLTPAGTIGLGADADNVRIDSSTHRVVTGYGSGALAIIDPVTRQKIREIPLKAHPESFQLETTGARIFVNVPDAHEIAIVDRATGKQTTSWSMRDLHQNFPLAIDEAHQRVLVMFRDPPTLGIFSMQDGALVAALNACRDADDIFVDAKRGRLYVSCGEGFVDTFERRAGDYVQVGRLTTVSGARTSLYVSELDRLYVAVRAVATTPAAIWILRPLVRFRAISGSRERHIGSHIAEFYNVKDGPA